MAQGGNAGGRQGLPRVGRHGETGAGGAGLTARRPSSRCARRARGPRCWPVAARPAGQPGLATAPAAAGAAPQGLGRLRATRRAPAPPQRACQDGQRAVRLLQDGAAHLALRVHHRCVAATSRDTPPWRRAHAPTAPAAARPRGCPGPQQPAARCPPCVCTCAGRRRGGLGAPHSPLGGAPLARDGAASRLAGGRSARRRPRQQRRGVAAAQPLPAGRAQRPAAQRAPRPATLASALLCRASPAQPAPDCRSRRGAAQASCC